MITDSWSYCPRVAINKLPDDVLLEIFSFYMVRSCQSYEEDVWHTLVHVCRRWRSVVFGSPRYLDLQLLCINKRLVNALDIWRELPIVIHVDNHEYPQLPSITNAISSLKRNDRVCKMFIQDVSNSLLHDLATTSDPFPALIELNLFLLEEDSPNRSRFVLGWTCPTSTVQHSNSCDRETAFVYS